MIYVVALLDMALITTVFVCERNNIRLLIFWLIITLFIPYLGFIIYMLFGNELKIRERKIIKNRCVKTKSYLKMTSWYGNYKKKNIIQLSKFQKKIYNKIAQNGFNEWRLSSLRIYTSGHEFVTDLKNDLCNAKSTINLQFYIFANDNVGKEISSILIRKAKEGVIVNLLYDSFGSQKTPDDFWSNLKDNGVNVTSFFPPLLKCLNTKINYRNHRKIVIIDGNVAYTGGINIRDDHMGDDKKTSPWRDTQVRITGGAVYALQDIFLNDFLIASKTEPNKTMVNKYFPKQRAIGNNIVQVVSSGPENDKKYIMDAYLQMIKNCKEKICIETPYFIVDKIIIKELISAKNRGVNIQIIIPGKPDKKLVYGMTLHALKELVYEGIDIYLYNGFIHSKMLIVDDVCSVGTCNFDNRSFNLNFEDTVFFYDNTINKLTKIFEQDINNSNVLSMKKYKKLTKKYKIYGLFYTFLSKLL